MIGWSTGSFKILRGTTTNASGDDIDDDTIVATGVHLGLRSGATGGATRSDSNVSGTPRTVTAWRGSSKATVDLRSFDRIVNERTGAIFLIEGVRPATSGVRRTGLRFEAHRVG
jgi:hypothetical protein